MLMFVACGNTNGNSNKVNDNKVNDSKVDDNKVNDSKVNDSKVNDNEVNDSKVNNNNTLTKKDKKMNTIELTKEEFLNKVANYKESPNEWKYLGDKPAIIDFYASWCGPCKMLSPILDEIAGEYKDSIIVYKVNTEKEQELAAVFGIKSIPTLLFIPLNETPQMTQGAMGKADLKKIIDKVLLKK